jgi:hypothetical protein
MHGDSDNFPVLNAREGSIAGTIELEFAVSDGKGNLYVNPKEQNEILHIDVNTLKVKDRWPRRSTVRRRLVYLSTGDGKVFAFRQDSPDKYSVAQEITTKPGAKTMG